MSTLVPRRVATGAPRGAAAAGTSSRRAATIRFVVVAAICGVWAFPLYWMAVTAVSEYGAVTTGRSPLVPRSLHLDGLREALQTYPVGTWLVNSTAIAVVAVAITVVVDLLAGFVLAKHRFRGRSLITLAIIGTLMIPIQVLLIPQFDLVADLGLLNSYWAVIIPRSAEAFGLFLARQYMLSIPDELLEAAALDGASQLRTLWSVVLPLCRPLIAVIVVMTFMYRWNEFAWPLVALRDPSLYTLPVGLAFLQGEHATDYPTLMGGALVSTLPVLVVFALAQRHFVAGLARSGLK